jgi:hypothetical protein
VEVNGTTVKPESGEDYNEMIVPVAAGESHVLVRFTRTWDRIVGGLLSVASAVFLLWLLVAGIRRRSAELEAQRVRARREAV